MIADREGFAYPYIDSANCTECGLCQKNCSFQDDLNTNGDDFAVQVFAAKHRDDSIRLSSSSGGMFTALSNHTLNKNGVIYGATFDDNFRVVHQKAESIIERNKLRGSKYVQSDLGNIFLDVKTALDMDRDVLFTGTPCQIAGLKAYLGGGEYERLILSDLVCHGTPSPLIWEDYVYFLKKKKGNLTEFNFRDKRTGWHDSILSAIFADGSIIFNTPIVDVFNSIFYYHVALRPSCHVCPFANFERVSDLTIADFWGIEKCKPHFDDNKGVSLVLLNTKKGAAIFEKIKNHLIYEESNAGECTQRNLIRPTEPSPKRDVFWEDYYKYGFEYVAKKYTDYGFINRVKHAVLKPVLSKFGIIGFVKKY